MGHRTGYQITLVRALGVVVCSFALGACSKQDAGTALAVVGVAAAMIGENMVDDDSCPRSAAQPPEATGDGQLRCPEPSQETKRAAAALTIAGIMAAAVGSELQRDDEEESKSKRQTAPQGGSGKWRLVRPVQAR